MQFRTCAKFALIITTLAAAACAPYERTSSAGKSPQASGMALWSHMQNEGYTRNWSMWPGKSAFYQGQEPHGALLTTYVNRQALTAINGRHGVMPEGAIVIKENYMPGRQLAAITVMYKVRNYDPDAGNWFWVKYQPDGSVDAEGKVPMCIGCHAVRRDNDYLYTGELK